MKKKEETSNEITKPVDDFIKKETEVLGNSEILTEKLKEVISDDIIDDKINQLNPSPKKRGRPSKTETEKNNPLKPSLTIPLSPIIDLIVLRLPNPLPLSTMEKSLIDDSGNKLLEKYSTNIKFLEEIQFSILLFGVLYPRLKTKSVNEPTKN
jgi:hypothetical protein